MCTSVPGAPPAASPSSCPLCRPAPPPARGDGRCPGDQPPPLCLPPPGTVSPRDGPGRAPSPPAPRSPVNMALAPAVAAVIPTRDRCGWGGLGRAQPHVPLATGAPCQLPLWHQVCHPPPLVPSPGGGTGTRWVRAEQWVEVSPPQLLRTQDNAAEGSQRTARLYCTALRCPLVPMVSPGPHVQLPQPHSLLQAGELRDGSKIPKDVCAPAAALQGTLEAGFPPARLGQDGSGVGGSPLMELGGLTAQKT